MEASIDARKLKGALDGLLCNLTSVETLLDDYLSLEARGRPDTDRFVEREVLRATERCGYMVDAVRAHIRRTPRGEY